MSFTSPPLSQGVGLSVSAVTWLLLWGAIPCAYFLVISTKSSRSTNCVAERKHSRQQLYKRTHYLCFSLSLSLSGYLHSLLTMLSNTFCVWPEVGPGILLAVPPIGEKWAQHVWVTNSSLKACMQCDILHHDSCKYWNHKREYTIYLTAMASVIYQHAAALWAVCSTSGRIVVTISKNLVCIHTSSYPAHFPASRTQPPCSSSLGWVSSTSSWLLYALPTRTYSLSTTCACRPHSLEWFLIKDDGQGTVEELPNTNTRTHMLALNCVTLTFSLDPTALQCSRCTFSSLFRCFNQPINSQTMI